jgi:uncharacterized membrane protein (UPF0127 family)
MQSGRVLVNGEDRGVRGNRCTSFIERAIGLLGRPVLQVTEALWIAPCPSVHTVGMRYPIDVIFCDGVVRIVENLEPDRVASAKGARHTCEMLAGSARRIGLTAGDRLVFSDALGA